MTKESKPDIEAPELKYFAQKPNEKKKDESYMGLLKRIPDHLLSQPGCLCSD